MITWLWLIPALPFVSATLLILFGSRLSRRSVAAVGVGSIGLSALVTALVAISFLTDTPPGHAYTQVLWTWISIGDFQPQIGFYLDALSLVMIVVVTFVGFLIHIFAAEFMIEDESYGRYFAYMNLFVASMLTLLLGNNLLLLLLGWEGVGVCSYLLIGFWYREPANGRAARKAFIVTRVGDCAMMIALFLLFTQLGTLQIQDLMQRASMQWPSGSTWALAAALLLLGGAVGKSAQIPLQVWLPDAMAGPTPTSALIHAATMVTAGVYLISRTHVLFSLAPAAQLAVGVVGAATLLLAGFSALTQHDIKRILAYSTISQIGYMFLALGVGAWQAAMFHFFTHAFFKALLFLGAGVIIEAVHDEHSIFRMGGLRKELPIAFWTFLAGGCALSGIAVPHGRVLQQRPHHLASVVRARRASGVLDCRNARRGIDVAVHLPADLPRLLRPPGYARNEAARLCDEGSSGHPCRTRNRGRISERAAACVSAIRRCRRRSKRAPAV